MLLALAAFSVAFHCAPALGHTAALSYWAAGLGYLWTHYFVHLPVATSSRWAKAVRRHHMLCALHHEEINSCASMLHGTAMLLLKLEGRCISNIVASLLPMVELVHNKCCLTSVCSAGTTAGLRSTGWPSASLQLTRCSARCLRPQRLCRSRHWQRGRRTGCAPRQMQAFCECACCEGCLLSCRWQGGWIAVCKQRRCG